jgi:thiol-disulfide isomerase/thioredoxin
MTGLSLACASLGLLALLAPAARADLQVGEVFPALAAAGLTGGTVPVTAGHVTIVDFWASWCAPCKASFPAYARLSAAYAAGGLVLVAVSVDDRAADYETFLRKWHPPFTTLRDARKHQPARCVGRAQAAGDRRENPGHADLVPARPRRPRAFHSCGLSRRGDRAGNARAN